jgi:DNA repair exonuclease SbcCD ATPase subunit
MIPLRVKLKGFLCYKDEQEINFDGASLWMLAGLNGSGKSTVFDAVTYAVFGHHRGGSQDAHELINKESERAVVEFDFALDGQRYQAYRTLQLTKQGKAKGTQQIYRRLPDGSREPVEGTSLKAGFDDWVQGNIGLSYETFTSSVLLLQGKADKLLDSTAKGRHEVLAGIVDLDRYKRLHQKADEQRKEEEAALKALKDRLTALPEVRAEALAAAAERIAAAEAARDQAQAEVERLQGLEFLARQWADLQGRLASARQRWEQARRLLADAPAIERDVNRLRELREFLPRLQTVVQQQSEIRKSEATARELAAQKQKLEARLEEQDHALHQTRQKRAAFQQRITAGEQKHRDLAGRLRQAAALLEKLKEYERHEGDLNRTLAELARLPADPAAAVREAQETYERLAALAQAVPLLERFHSQREELRQARPAVARRAADLQTVQAQGEQLAAEIERLKPALQEAERLRRRADDEATRARTLLEQARQQRDELEQLHGAKVCRHCGQALTAGHVRDEKARREREAAAAERQFQKAAAEQEAAQKHERELGERLAALDRQLREAREEFREKRTKAEGARRDAERLERECGRTYHELPAPFRTPISPAVPADWLDTVYPTAGELAGAGKQASGLPAAARSFRAAQEVQTKWTGLTAQEAAARQTLARLQAELPADRASVRGQHVRLETEEQALDRDLAALRGEALATQEQLDRLTREREQVQRQLAELKGRLGTEEATRQLCRQAVESARRELPADWQALAERAGLADLHKLHDERDRLAAQETDERGQQLQQARVGLEMLRRDKEELERQEAGFPEEAHRDPGHFQALVQKARQAHRTCDEELVRTQQQQVQLESYREQRGRLEGEIRRADGAAAQAKLLADLLGRDRLQLHLVRQAERQVVDYANTVLDRLSGGQLYLRLCGEAAGDGNSAKALELETHNRSTGDRPINVAFLSGSQKFRVAVSLALGIGQYASRRHRPIESVIIDEGFGCLDKEGRQAMIQEMQNLRDQLKCILLVSHQEEFADAFADGYLFELKDRTTRATRFQR